MQYLCRIPLGDYNPTFDNSEIFQFVINANNPSTATIWAIDWLKHEFGRRCKGEIADYLKIGPINREYAFHKRLRHIYQYNIAACMDNGPDRIILHMVKISSKLFTSHVEFVNITTSILWLSKKHLQLLMKMQSLPNLRERKEEGDIHNELQCHRKAAA